MIDEAVIELINRELDNDLSESEQTELDKILAKSESARHYRANLKSLDTLMAKQPAVAMPDGLHETIIGSIRLTDRPVSKPAIIARRNWTRVAGYGLATAAGLLLAVGLFRFSPDMGLGQTDQMTGTMAPRNDNPVLLGDYFVETDKLSSSVSLERRGAELLLQVDLDSQVPTELSVNFSGSNLLVKAVTQVDDNLKLTQSPNRVSVSGQGRHGFTVFLDRGDDTVNTMDQAIALEYSSNGRLIREAELIVRDE